MNTPHIGHQAATALEIGRPVSAGFNQSGESKDGLNPLVAKRELTHEEKGYAATCEESYNIQRQILAAYAMYPDHLYAI